ncbi:MAG: hypothetical protein ACP5N3_02415 [Candidatus Nanoarchaeia archaeon]
MKNQTTKKAPASVFSKPKISKEEAEIEKIEQEVFQENLKDAIIEAKKPDPNAKDIGITGIIIGAIGLFTPPPINVVTGVFAAILGVYANHHKRRTLGIICGILAILNLLSYLLLSLGRFPFYP